nr:MAG TPA: minor structural protein [Caudoviricetes sp.]
MKRKFLEDLGLEPDAIEKIMAEVGKDVTSLKARVDELTEKINVKETIIEEKNEKIAEFEKVDVEAIKKEQFDLGKAEGSKEIENFKRQNALEKALSKYKAKDTSIINKMLDMEKVKFDDKYEIVEGLEEQVKKIQETHDYLFDSDKALPSFSDTTPGTENNISGNLDEMDYNTYKKWRKENI